MIIGMSCTKNWYFYVAVNLYALFKHNNVEKVYLFIEDDEIPFIQDKRIEYININKLPEFVCKTSPNYNTQYTRMALARCYFTKILKCDKIIYIDADAIVVDNIKELWDLDLQDNVIAGVHEGGEWDRHLNTYGMNDTYINTGVLVMDLKKLREEQLDDTILWLLNNRYLQFPDQDAINLVCRNRTKYLSNEYNSAETTGFAEKPKIYHYIRGNKGWIKESQKSEIWFKYRNEMLGGVKMGNCKVKAKIDFDDYLGKEPVPENEHIHRNVNDEWTCTVERGTYLAVHNAVDIIEVEKVEMPEEKDEIEEEIKKIVKSRKRRTK